MRLQSYAHKPKAKFFGTDAYYLGIELEVEAPDDEKRESGLSLMPRPHGMYAKRDGSLNSFGWELVTHPIARNEWLAEKPRGPVKKFFDLLGHLRQMKYQSHDGGRCGLHLHVCRKAFDNAEHTAYNRYFRSVHYYFFSRLINGTLFRTLSQRTADTLNRFAKQKFPSPKTAFVAISSRTTLGASHVR